MLKTLRHTLFALLVCAAGLPAQAADPTATPQAAEMEAASSAARAAQVAGPKAIPLGDQAVLQLPAGYAYIPSAEAARLMNAMGNHTGEGFHGLVVGEQLEGFVTIRFEKAGYVKDDEAREWNADELLENLKEGTEAGNAERRTRGIPEFVVSGWVEKPAYDAATHRLVWSAALRDKTPAAAGGDGAGVNYNTYQLGREGYMSMNLVTDLAGVEQQKPHARQLLAGLEFNAGKRYTDFDSSTDKVAAYGLAALVGGVAAKKIGLLATLGIFLAKFWKLDVLAVVGLGAGARKFFRKKEAT
jgi:uncharacterized membrane-anchored protein